MNAGDTFFAPLYPHKTSHLWLILSDPSLNSSEIVVVPFMTRDYKNKSQDTTCTLDVGDHPFLKHPTYVNFDVTSAPSLSAILREKTGDDAPLSPGLLKKIREGAQKSDRCNLRFVRILEDQKLISPQE